MSKANYYSNAGIRRRHSRGWCGCTHVHPNGRPAWQESLVARPCGKVCAKILISGGGRCNFTNLHSAPDRFLSGNPDFCRSALGRHTQTDFIAVVERHGIPYHEKTLGQLFCDGSARAIVAMLLAECARGSVDVGGPRPK